MIRSTSLSDTWFIASIVETCGAGAFMIRHLLRHLELAAASRACGIPERPRPVGVTCR